jgi:hypothetical protein
MPSDWYYTHDGLQYGPITSRELRAVARAGKLLLTDFVWKSGMSHWKEAGKARHLFASLAPPVLPQPSVPVFVGAPTVVREELFAPAVTGSKPSTNGPDPSVPATVVVPPNLPVATKEPPAPEDAAPKPIAAPPAVTTPVAVVVSPPPIAGNEHPLPWFYGFADKMVLLVAAGMIVVGLCYFIFTESKDRTIVFTIAVLVEIGWTLFLVALVLVFLDIGRELRKIRATLSSGNVNQDRR